MQARVLGIAAFAALLVVFQVNLAQATITNTAAAEEEEEVQAADRKEDEEQQQHHKEEEKEDVSQVEVIQFSTNQKLRIIFIDVGQGDSTLIILPNDKTVLIDGGERNQSQKILAILQENQVSMIDVVVATHPHADHIGGLIGVINGIEVGEILDSGQIHTTRTFEDFIDAIDSNNIPLRPVREGETIDLDPEVQLFVLNPHSRLPVGAHDPNQLNNNSVVIKLVYGKFSAIFPGDIEREAEQRLVAEAERSLNVNVLLASHHGSRGSNTPQYLAAAAPEVVVIYSGMGNPYGHPHPEVLDRIDAANVQHVFRTDIDGTIILESDGSSEYTLRTLGSDQVVVIPEFTNAAILIASMSLISLILLANRSTTIWKSLRQA